ncbi:MAG: aspartate aminotransferase family protein [Aquificaceae bacterium]|nr:aspartate aminotransferase family protein [Aquificaceae bacterium]
MDLMETYKRLPVRFSYGKGVYLFDQNGKRYLDMIAGIAVNSLGHAHQELSEAICKQASKLLHISNLYENPWQEELARELLSEFWTSGKVFFCNSGAEANEAAIKLVRKYFKDRGENRYRIITFHNSFHGRTLGALSATAQERLHSGFEPLLDGFDYATFDDFESVLKLIKPETAAILLEIIQGEGGINEASAEFLKKINDLCDKEGLLFVIDEVQTGVGRTGKFFAYSHFDLQPHIITLAKGLGGGVPIGAIIAKSSVASAFSPGSHGSTFGGNPLACSASLVVVKNVKRLLDSVEKVGTYLKSGLEYLNVGKVKGRGLMLGLEIDKDCQDVVLRALENGLLVNCTAKRVIRLLPPLILSEGEAKEALDLLKKSL